MKRIKFIVSLSIFLISISSALAQTRIIANLKQNIVSANTAAKKLQAILLLCDQGYSLHPDTLLLYAQKAAGAAILLKDRNSEVKAMYHKSAALTNKALLDSALSEANQCQVILQNEIQDPILLANVLNQKGRCYVRKNNYKQAIEMGYATIALGEKNNDVLLQVKGKTLIGWAYLEMSQFKDALNWHLKALNTTNDTLLLEKYGILFGNLATNYNNLGKKDSAFYYIKKGIDYSRKHENLFALSNSLAIASAINVSVGQAKKSEPLLKEVVEIRKLIGDPFYTASDLAQLAYYYAHYGQPEKGIAACEEGIALAHKYNLSTKLFFLYQSLADNYKAMGKMEEYGQAMENIIRLKDSVYAKNSSNELADLNAKYELQKKENTIIQQRYELLQKTYWMYGAVVLMLFGVLLWYINYKDNKRKQEQKMALALMEEKRISEKAVLVAQELERKRIAADLHDNLGAYAAAISSNVDNIAVAKNGHDNTVYEELKNNSQSIVSQLNDTIWVLTKERLALTSISDRLKVFIQRINKSYPHVQIDVKENIETDRTLAPMQALNLFKILQEAIINALKHSGCSKVIITIESNINWKITIEDNGNGFQENALSKTGGNGLYNMKNRSMDGGWSIDWLGNEPVGTRVIISSTTN
ncbi:MAG: ATP-binding protein [Bacteroidota bacterium]